MADVRINALSTTATSAASDDYLALDGSANGTRKILATNVAQNVTDVTFGTSGPSAKSSIAARAARQGLVFDGTAGATVSIASLGTAFTIHLVARPNVAGSNLGIFRGSGGSIAGNSYFLSDGRAAIYNGSFYIASTSTITANKTDTWTYVLSGGTGTWYKNGVVDSTTSDAGTYPNALDRFGVEANGYVYQGAMSGLIYNRALSAAEVVSLYEAGVPSGADYVNGGTTAPTGGTFLNYQYDTFTGASATGFTAAETGGQNCVAYSNYTSGVYAVGTKIKVTFSATLTSGATPTVYLANLAGTPVATSATVVAGSNSQTFTLTTATTVAQYLQLVFSTSGNTSYAISSVVVQPLGLLLAPDAAQAGGGLTWYDTSGNAANITLPASGVTWNVPTSSKSATGWSFGGNLLVGTTTDAGYTIVGRGTDASVAAMSADSTSQLRLNAQSGIAILETVTNTPLRIRTNSTEAMRVGTNGNVLLGTTTDSANGKLQLATHTTSAGGIGFGTDTTLFRSSAGILSIGDGTSTRGLIINGAAANAQVLLFQQAGTEVARIGLSASTSLVLATGANVTALTLDSSQQTFTAASVKIGSLSGTIDSRLHVYESAAAGTGNGVTVEQAGAGDAVAQFLLTGVQRWSAGIDNSDSDAFVISAGALGTSNALRLATTGDAKFYAKINAASLPTSSAGLSAGDLWVDTAAGNVVKRV